MSALEPEAAKRTDTTYRHTNRIENAWCSHERDYTINKYARLEHQAFPFGTAATPGGNTECSFLECTAFLKGIFQMEQEHSDFVFPKGTFHWEHSINEYACWEHQVDPSCYSHWEYWMSLWGTHCVPERNIPNGTGTFKILRHYLITCILLIV